MKEIDDKCLPGTGIFDLRLHHKPCFIKLCEPTPFEYDSVDRIKGTYLAREHFEIVLQASATDGARGERLIGEATAPRHLNNSTFTTLLAQGWIGSCGIGNNFVRQQAQLSLERRGALVFGLHTSTQPLGNGIRQISW